MCALRELGVYDVRWPKLTLVCGFKPVSSSDLIRIHLFTFIHIPTSRHVFYKQSALLCNSRQNTFTSHFILYK